VEDVMRVRTGFLGGGMLALAALGYLLAVVLVGGASAHTDPCHPQHTCPSDHHTYVWTDPATGLQWDCVEPGAREYDPVLDTTTIVWAGRTYDCRAAGGLPTSTITTTVTTSTSLPTTAPEPISTETTTATTIGPILILPIPSITPGAPNPRVRQGTIGRTICKPGWTATIRPKPSYTTALKIKQMPLYEEGGPTSAYEEDHFVPLELGGAPKNSKNLWPEPRSQAGVSDPLETKLKRRVCSRLMTLAQARAEIRTFKNENG
jgi:hypothetical protein